MWRTLRVRLTLLTTVIALLVLLVSTLLVLHLSTRLLETQAREYADLLAHQVTLTVETFWLLEDRERLAKKLKSFAEGHEGVTAIEVFFFDGVHPRVIRSQPQRTAIELSQEERQAVENGRTMVSHTWREGQRWVAVLVPLRNQSSHGIGAVRVWTRVLGLQRLQSTETRTTFLLTALFIGAIFFALKAFLNAYVSRPLELLTTAMQITAAGNFAARTALTGQDEIGQLGGHFNRMLTRLEEANAENQQLMTQLQQMNGELEERVTRATQDLVVRNQDLLRLQREMARVEPLAALGRIMGSIAHELGTPLNSVMGYSQMLAQENLSPDARTSLEAISTQTRRMIDIVQHYLGRTRDVARAYQPLNLNTLIESTTHILKPSLLQHRVDVTMTLAEDLPLIHGESASLQRVLINIINNAIDAMDGGGRLHITTRASHPPETRRPGVIVEVVDTGSGIPPEVLPHIFDPLVTTKAPGKGTGLGLAICQEIVRGHRGRLSLSSEVGKGTSVRIFLPTAAHAKNATHSEESR